MSQEEIARALEGLQRDVDKLGNQAVKRLALEMADQRIAACENSENTSINISLSRIPGRYFSCLLPLVPLPFGRQGPYLYIYGRPG
jgi:hypothetical protein